MNPELIEKWVLRHVEIGFASFFANFFGKFGDFSK